MGHFKAFGIHTLYEWQVKRPILMSVILDSSSNKDLLANSAKPYSFTAEGQTAFLEGDVPHAVQRIPRYTHLSASQRAAPFFL